MATAGSAGQYWWFTDPSATKMSHNRFHLQVPLVKIQQKYGAKHHLSIRRLSNLSINGPWNFLPVSFGTIHFPSSTNTTHSHISTDPLGGTLPGLFDGSTVGSELGPWRFFFCGGSWMGEKKEYCT